MQEITSVFGINWKLLLVQAVNFAVLLAALWYFLYRPVMRLLDKRREKIAQGIKDAEAAALKLEAAEAEKAAALRRATTEAEAIIERAHEREKTQKEEFRADLHAEGVRAITEAAARAEEIKRAAREESREEIARLAVLAAKKVLEQQRS